MGYSVYEEQQLRNFLAYFWHNVHQLDTSYVTSNFRSFRGFLIF
jgi:hypothetical protein